MPYKKQKKNLYIISLVVILCAITLSLYSLFNSNRNQPIGKRSATNQQHSIQLTQLTVPTTPIAPETPNFVSAAQKATPAVVHITAKYEAKIMRRGTSPIEELFKDFLGEGFELGPKEYKTQPGAAFGSGVIISEDGYIVTNNHVIDKADQIEVTLDDNRRYTAKVVGTDPDTDLALLKIEEKSYPS